MNKSKIYILLLVVSLALTACVGKNGEKIDYEDDVGGIIEERAEDKKGVRGSCNQIPSKSACIDFIGSVFTEERMKLSCAEGGFYKTTCPHSELGGCQAAAGTMGESIIWSYDRGGQPLSEEEAEFAAKACNASPAARWVKPEDLLKQYNI